MDLHHKVGYDKCLHNMKWLVPSLGDLGGDSGGAGGLEADPWLLWSLWIQGVAQIHRMCSLSRSEVGGRRIERSRI